MKENRKKRQNPTTESSISQTVPFRGKKYLQIFAALLWAALILLCFLYRDELSLDELLNHTPKNPWLAALVMLALFALKSLSLVLYSGLLYAANGILFPLPAAIFLNLCGAVIMLSLPYAIGRKNGASAIRYVQEKYPKFQILQSFSAKNDLALSFLARIVRLPSDVVSLYMGAIQVNYKKYLLGSLMGILPHTITYPLMGMNIRDLHSPEFKISLLIEIVYVVTTSVLYLLYSRRHPTGASESRF